jgi:hypothetical protein
MTITIGQANLNWLEWFCDQKVANDIKVHMLYR